jgi:RNA-binding protein 26
LQGHEHLELEVTPTLTKIPFKQRFEAEKVMYGVENNDIPGIGKVELSWIQTPLPPIDLAKTIIRAENGEDTPMDEGDAMAPISSPAHHAPGHEQTENIDYDVADDNDWGQVE